MKTILKSSGFWYLVIAALHTGFGLVWFGDVLVQLAASGLWDSVGQDPERGAVAFYFIFGFTLIPLGLALMAYERRVGLPPALHVVLSALIIWLVAAVFIPEGGFWLGVGVSLYDLLRLAMRRRKAQQGGMSSREQLQAQ